MISLSVLSSGVRNLAVFERLVDAYGQSPTGAPTERSCNGHLQTRNLVMDPGATLQ